MEEKQSKNLLIYSNISLGQVCPWSKKGNVEYI